MSVPRETLTAEVDVSRETWERIEQFERLLKVWTQRINLIAARDLDHIRERHTVNSLTAAALIPHTVKRAIDLGSGGGFPGLVLAIATNIHFDLIESDHRKSAFLAEAARVTNAPVTIHSERIESCPCDPAMLVTCRALAPLSNLLTLAKPLMQPGAICLFLKGKQAEQEIAEASRAWTMSVDQFTMPDERGGVVLRISEVARV